MRHVDGVVETGDRLISVDGEPVRATRAWSIAKIRRIIASRANTRVSLEFDRGGRKLLAALSREATSSVKSVPLDASLGASSTHMSLSALSEKDAPVPSVSRLGGSYVVQMEQLHERCKVFGPNLLLCPPPRNQ